MTRKRKRANTLSSGVVVPRSLKHLKVRCESGNSFGAVQHPTLDLYYTQTLTLRDYLLSKLPKTSKGRRRKLAGAGDHASTNRDGEFVRLGAQKSTKDPPTSSPSSNGDDDLARTLDSTLVCNNSTFTSGFNQVRTKDFQIFSQQLSSSAASSLGEGASSQSELIDFVIWLLFHRVYRDAHRPPHLLCQGYQRASMPRHLNQDHCAVAGIPGVFSHYPNNNVNVLKGAVWADILSLLGKDGEEMMVEMLIHGAIFAPVPEGRGNYYQLSGIPLTDMHPLQLASKGHSLTSTLIKENPSKKRAGIERPVVNSPASITLVRSRMLYARPALNAKGNVTFGLRHIHALNRHSDPGDFRQTVLLMKYVFPRQFGLHNAFTSRVDPQETAQPFKDYTLREQEIIQRERRLRMRWPAVQNLETHLPKRLRGKPSRLIQNLQRRNSRCSYSKLLEHYCPKVLYNPDAQPMRLARRQPKPSKRSKHARTKKALLADDSTLATASISRGAAPSRPSAADLDLLRPIENDQGHSFINLATPHAQVSAFCRFTLSKVIPDEFWGEGEARLQNKAMVMNSVDRFVRLRRFENFSFHALTQGVKVRVYEPVLRRSTKCFCSIIPFHGSLHQTCPVVKRP